MIALWAAVLILAAGLLWIRRRRRRQHPFTTRSGVMASPPKMPAVRDAGTLVYVNENGSVRELTAAERIYVQTEFSPLDGARPYIKSRYGDRTGWGMQGYLPRAEVPDGISIEPEPPDSAAPPQTAQAVADSLLERIRKFGQS